MPITNQNRINSTCAELVIMNMADSHANTPELDLGLAGFQFSTATATAFRITGKSSEILDSDAFHINEFNSFGAINDMVIGVDPLGAAFLNDHSTAKGRRLLRIVDVRNKYHAL
jgi:hypothetical protein